MTVDPRTFAYFRRGQVSRYLARVSTKGLGYSKGFHLFLGVFDPVVSTPIILDTPVITYTDSYTRIGDGSTASATFTPWDGGFTSYNALTYQVYTGASQTGTFVTSGSCTSGSVTSASIVSTASGLVNGSNTLYLSLTNGTNHSTDVSFAVLVDQAAPTSAGSITLLGSTTDPVALTNLLRPVLDQYTYTIGFTPVDATSTSSSDIRYQLRTGTDGGGDLITGPASSGSGLATSGAPVSRALTDIYMTSGCNVRYLRLIDAGGNATDFVYSYIADVRPQILGTASVRYNGLTRTGPNNTPYAVEFTPFDPDQTSASGLQYGFYAGTSPPTGLFGSTGSCTSGIVTSASFAYDTTGVVEGHSSGYLFLHDGYVFSTNSPSISVDIYRDDTAPTSASPISISPTNIPGAGGEWATTFTPVDAISTSASEITYAIYTGSGATGTLLTVGVCTSGVPITTGIIENDVLDIGSYTLYLRLTDGGNNTSEFSFDVTVIDAPVITGATISYG